MFLSTGLAEREAPASGIIHADDFKPLKESGKSGFPFCDYAADF